MKQKHNNIKCNHDEEIYKADGIDNLEHIIDVFNEIKMLRENITDNTDLAFNLLQAIKEDGEADIVDSLTIMCSDILEQEKQSKDIFEKAEILVENSKKDLKNEELQKIQSLLMEYFNAIKLSEKNSQILVEKVVKNFK